MAAGLLASVTRPTAACHAPRPLGWAVRFVPPGLPIPAPQATGLGCPARAPSTQAGPAGGAALRPGASSHSHSDRGLLAAVRPLPGRGTRAVAPPGASGALPACRSSAPPRIADTLRASLHPLSALPRRPSRSEWPRALPAGPVSQSLHQLGIEAPVFSPLPSAPGRQTGLGIPRLSASPPAPALSSSSTQWAALSPRLGLRGLDPHGCQAESGGSALSIRLGGPGPGLLASGRASPPRPPPPNSRAIPARRLDILASPARSSPSVSSVPANRSASPASEVQALPASP